MSCIVERSFQIATHASEHIEEPRPCGTWIQVDAFDRSRTDKRSGDHEEGCLRWIGWDLPVLGAK